MRSRYALDFHFCLARVIFGGSLCRLGWAGFLS